MATDRLRIRLPGLHDGGQRQAYESPARFKIGAAGRRWGKSRLGVASSLTVASGRRLWLPENTDPGRCWWVPPYYKQGQVAWRALEHVARGIDGAAIHRGANTIVLPNGGSITIMTGDNPDALRSEGLDFVVLDESAFHRDAAIWSEALRPALADKRGGALLISTPKGLNWFHDLFEAADEMEGWMRFQHPTSDNPHIHPDEIEAARNDPSIGSLAFSQEYLAEFVQPEGNLLNPKWNRYYTMVRGDETTMLRIDGEAYDLASLRRFGMVDPATTKKTHADYTAIASLASTSRGQMAVLDMERDRVEGPEVPRMVARAIEKWDLSWVGIEAVSGFKTIYQLCRRAGLPVRQVTPQRDKVARVLTLAARLEAGDVFFLQNAPWLEDLEKEMRAFAADDSHDHDDQVDTLAYGAIHLSRASKAWTAY